jgi:hypothetical protein
MTDDRPPLDERLTTRQAMETGVPEGVAAFPDQMPEPVDVALDQLDAMPTTTRPVLTITEAADATGKSRRTIARLLDAHKLDGAERDEAGTWRIPSEALIAAKLTLHAPSPPDAVPEAVPPTSTPADSTEADHLRAELADWRHRAQVAESRRELAEHDRDAARAVATERAESLADLRVALRMLAAGPQTPTPAPPSTPSTSPPPTVDPRYRWWRKARP